MGAQAQRTTPMADGHASSDATDRIQVCRRATLRPAEYQFYRALLLTFPATGSPPDRTLLRTLARRYGVPLQATLTEMARQDLVQCDPRSGAIRAAYPFSGVPTPHRVTLLASPVPTGHPADSAIAAPVEVYAMCALDALGIPLMFGCDALVSSVDAHSGEAIRVWVRRLFAAAGALRDGNDVRVASPPDGTGWGATWEPSTAVVFARPEDHECEGSVAAGSCCPLTNFFATREQAEQWATVYGSPTDVVLSPDAALRRAESLFGGVLDRLAGDGPGGQVG
jgi:Alkylmercury lyase